MFLKNLNPRNATVYWHLGVSVWIVSPSVATVAADVKPSPIADGRVGRRGRDDPPFRRQGAAGAAKPIAVSVALAINTFFIVGRPF